MDKSLADMMTDELKGELARVEEGLQDIEDMHAFTFGKTSVHIGSEKAQNMQAEFEEECRAYNEKIAEIKKALKEKGAL